MDFAEAFGKIRDNTLKFKDKINGNQFQDKFRSPFVQPAGDMASDAQAPESPEVIDYSDQSRQVTGPNTGMQGSPAPAPVPAPETAPAPVPAPETAPAPETVPETASAPETVPMPETPGDQPAGKQIGNTNKDVANAQPGDWIIRSNGDKVVLTQAHIDWAKNKIGGQGNKASQTEDKGNVPPDSTMSSDASTESVSMDVPYTKKEQEGSLKNRPKQSVQAAKARSQEAHDKKME